MGFQEDILKELKKLTKQELSLEVPPDSKLGDFALPCFSFAKEMKKSPVEIAKELSEKVKVKNVDVKATGPYLNFFLDKAVQSEGVLKKILKENDNFGRGKSKNKNIMLEFFHANTHKGVHIGHIRNICMGISISRLLEFAGYKVIRVNYQGDIGPHVAKCMWGYENLKEKEPKDNKGIWLGKIYAKASQKAKEDEKIEEEIRTLTKRLYDEDKELMPLWKKTRQWCLDDFDKLYKEFEVKFDRLYFESEVEGIGKKEVKKLLDKGIAEESDGAIIVNMEKDNMGVYLLLRNDGVGLYSTKDLGLAMLKQKEFKKIDRSLHLVGKEQELYFRQLFKTFELMNMKEFAEKSKHLIYGLVMLPEGKMSSREGNMVLYDELKLKLIELAEEEVKKRHSDWEKKDVETAVKAIAFGALKFSMVSKELNRQIVFDWEKALDFEGETGPYLQYTHARICSILRKYDKKVNEKIDFSLLKEDDEKELVTMLGNFPDVVEKAAENQHSHAMARYLLDLAQKFNEFYHKHQVLKAEEDLKEARLILVNCTKQVLNNGLLLLGMDAPERM